MLKAQPDEVPEQLLLIWGWARGERCVRARTIFRQARDFAIEPIADAGTAPLCAYCRCTSIRGLCDHRANSGNSATH